MFHSFHELTKVATTPFSPRRFHGLQILWIPQSVPADNPAIGQANSPFVRSSCVVVSPGSLSTAILLAKCDSLVPLSLSILTKYGCGEDGGGTKDRRSERRPLADRRKNTRCTSDLVGREVYSAGKAKEVWLGIRCTCTCMSQAPGRWSGRGCVLKGFSVLQAGRP